MHGQTFETKCYAKDEVIGWLLWYNRARLHSVQVYVSSMQLEKNCFANHPKQANL